MDDSPSNNDSNPTEVDPNDEVAPTMEQIEISRVSKIE